jgi:hypothetical protein
MNDDEADTLYNLMPKTYRQRVTREQFRFLFPRLIKPVVAGPQLRQQAGQTPRGILSLLRSKSLVSRNGFSASLKPLPVPAVYLS